MKKYVFLFVLALAAMPVMAQQYDGYSYGSGYTSYSTYQMPDFVPLNNNLSPCQNYGAMSPFWIHTGSRQGQCVYAGGDQIDCRAGKKTLRHKTNVCTRYAMPNYMPFTGSTFSNSGY
ncbi:MAG: hypothetical protein V1837_05335 [Candidatus Woesearchaeota archaeon]